MRIAFVNYVWAADLPTPERLLERYFTLTDWSDAVKHAGAGRVTVHQRFSANATIERHEVEYRFHRDGGRPSPSLWGQGAGRQHEAIAASRPDVVHVNGVLHPRRLRHLRAALPQTTAVVVQDHGGFDPSGPGRAKRAWIRHGLMAADALLVSSPGQAEEWRRSGIVPDSAAIFDVMECGTSMVPVARELARALSGVDGSPAILWVGRLNDNKDPLTVLRGIAEFFERHRAARMTMVFAERDREADVRGLIAARPSLASRVRLVGRIPASEMAAYFSSADLFVLGSHREGSGYAAIEAVASGVLPVLTDIPSFRAITDAGRLGELWEVGHAGSLVQALTRATARASDSQRRACRDFFNRHLSWPAIGRRAFQIYQETQARRRAIIDLDMREGRLLTVGRGAPRDRRRPCTRAPSR